MKLIKNFISHFLNKRRNDYQVKEKGLVIIIQRISIIIIFLLFILLFTFVFLFSILPILLYWAIITESQHKSSFKELYELLSTDKRKKYKDNFEWKERRAINKICKDLRNCFFVEFAIYNYNEKNILIFIIYIISQFL